VRDASNGRTRYEQRAADKVLPGLSADQFFFNLQGSRTQVAASKRQRRMPVLSFDSTVAGARYDDVHRVLTAQGDDVGETIGEKRRPTIFATANKPRARRLGRQNRSSQGRGIVSSGASTNNGDVI